MYTYIYVLQCNWITLLYTWNEHNIVRQLYFNFKKSSKPPIEYILYIYIYIYFCLYTLKFENLRGNKQKESIYATEWASNL